MNRKSLFGAISSMAILVSTTSCGAAVCAQGSCSPPSPGPAAATAGAHGWATSVAIEPPAGPLDVRVSVPGPLQVDDGCVAPLTAWAVGADGVRVEASPTPGLACHAIGIDDIPSGQTRAYTATIPRPRSGTITIHGLLRVHLPIGAGARVSENIPVATLIVP